MFRLFSFGPTGGQLKAIVDDFSSLIFQHHYTGIGDWQLVIDGRKANADAFDIGDIYEIEGRRWGIVTYVNRRAAIDGDNMTTVKGMELKGITRWRVVVPESGNDQVSFTSARTEAVIKGLIAQSITAPTNANRDVPHVSNIATGTRGALISFQSRLKNLGDELVSIATAQNMGWYAYYDYSANEIYFDVYEGIDRTAGQSLNNRVLLGLSYGNLLDRDLTSDYQNFANVAYTAGQGEGAARAIVTVNDASFQGIYRHETFVDARDLDTTPELSARGLEKLAEFGGNDTFSGSFDPNSNYEYSQDFAVGDIITIIDGGLAGGKKDERITGVTEVYTDSEPDAVKIELGYSQQNIINPIKRRFNSLDYAATI